eukprot:14462469-Alexandrium_andersonii.AAC.1
MDAQATATAPHQPGSGRRQGRKTSRVTRSGGHDQPTPADTEARKNPARTPREHTAPGLHPTARQS